MADHARAGSQLMNARHEVAAGAGAIAEVAAQVARALAWAPKDDCLAVFESDLEAALQALDRAERALRDARLRVGLVRELLREGEE